jgi:hypothetical protein
MEGGADGSGLGLGRRFPVVDGVRAEEEELGGVVGVPGEEVLDLEDAETRGGSEVRPMLLGDLGESGAEEVRGLPGEVGAELGFLEPGLLGGEGVPGVAEVAKVCSGGDTEEASGGEDGAEGELFGLLLEGGAQAEMNGGRGVDQARLLSGEERSLAGGERRGTVRPGARRVEWETN